MKKFIYLTVAMAAALALTACGSDNDGDLDPDPNKPNPEQPDPEQPTHSAGAYFLCQGQFYEGIEGGMYALDYTTGSMATNVFKTANSITLGDTPQCGVCYGSKIYLGIYESNCIFVINKKDYKIIKTISLANSAEGQQPRSMEVKDGKVYIGMYNGYVARMDTTSLEIDKSVKVGPNPEIIGIHGNDLYVPNSDGMNYPNYGTTASVIDLSSFTVKSTMEVPLNPYQFTANETGLYLLCKGDYGAIPSQVYKVEGDKCTLIAPATMMALDDKHVYAISTPYMQPVEYNIYDGSKLSKWEILPVDAPSNVAVDKVAGKIFISSNVLSGGTPSYTTPGYVNMYDIDSKFEKKFDIGIGMPCIFFNQD